jgi:hypothetical protein
MSGLSTPNLESVVGVAKQLSKLSAAPIAALSALAFVSTCAPVSAHTYEYCRQDVSSHMLQCSFDTLEQCKWTSSGRGGDCLRDPFLPAPETLAYAPKAINGKPGAHRARSATCCSSPHARRRASSAAGVVLCEDHMRRLSMQSSI